MVLVELTCQCLRYPSVPIAVACSQDIDAERVVLLLELAARSQGLKSKSVLEDFVVRYHNLEAGDQ